MDNWYDKKSQLNKMKFINSIFILFLLSFVNIPLAETIESVEVIRFCRKTRNYRMCLREFGYNKPKLKTKVQNNGPIEIEVIPYRE